jgi:large subunit ribosomal protein L3
LGKKLGMTQIVADSGKLIPVTVIEAGPCCVVQVKTQAKDGYEAVRVGFIEARKEKNITKPLKGVFKKTGTPMFRILKEFRMSGLKVGDVLNAGMFNKGDIIAVSGISKGKGFQGVMKRHKFKGGPGSHGSMFNRAPGSIGASSFPSRVWKGLRMAGQMGSARVAIRNLEVIDVRPEQNIILVKGAVPGSANSIVEICKD